MTTIAYRTSFHINHTCIDATVRAYLLYAPISSRVRRYRLIPLTEPYIRASYTAHAINLPRTRGQ